MAATSTSQPSASMAATSASQPSASSSSADARGSDVGAPQPGMSHSNISPIVTEVLEFGRIPMQKKNPRTKEVREETSLAQRLSKKKKSLTDLDRLQLAALTEEREAEEKKTADREKLEELQQLREQSLGESLLNEVRQLGYYPKETRANPVECSLAMRLRRALQHKCFNQAQLENSTAARAIGAPMRGRSVHGAPAGS